MSDVLHRRVSRTWLTIALLVGGCAEPEEEPEPEGLDPGSFDITGVVMGSFALQVIEGVEVCVVEAPRVGCTQTAANGTYALAGLPDDAHVHVSYAKDGYVEYLWAVDTSVAEDVWQVGLLTNEQAADWLEVGGLQWNTRLGSVVFKALQSNGQGASGISVELVEGQYHGPIYLEGEQAVAASTETDGTGLGALANVEVGVWDLVYDPGPGRTCTPRWGWAGSTASSIEVESIVGATTFVEMLCE